MRPGLVGAHLLHTELAALAPTTEQKIRGHTDRAADWIFMVAGEDRQALAGLVGAELSCLVLQRAGARPGACSGTYALQLARDAGGALPTLLRERG